MHPELFITQDETTALIPMLANLLDVYAPDAVQRGALLKAAGVQEQFMLSGDSFMFATQLAAKFRTYSWSESRPDYHPLVQLLDHLSRVYANAITDEAQLLFVRLLARGQVNLIALRRRSAIGRVESPLGVAIGTGTLIGPDLLLTCAHIFTKSQAQSAWVRFRYRNETGFSLAPVFALKLQSMLASSAHDFALVRLEGSPAQQRVRPQPALLDSGLPVRMIHHPGGKPVVFSPQGHIQQVGEDYIDHDIPTEPGSSGAPIFDSDWNLIALHQGNPGLGRTPPAGTTSGITIRAFWPTLEPQLPLPDEGDNS